MTKIHDVIAVIESFASSAFQESYDNSGLQLGNRNTKVHGALICVDVTQEIVDEAIRKKTNLIISHHPLIFSGLKRITGNNSVERIVEQCIKHDIALYAAHTNLDSVQGGVSYALGYAIGLENLKILDPVSGALSKLVTFVSKEYSALVREALFKAGAGNIGQYDKCSYNLEGKGTFRGSDSTQPFVGKKNQLHTEAETRIETIFPNHIKSQVVRALLENHPYEEVAYDIYSIDNEWPQVGMGAIGTLPKPMEPLAFLKQLKKKIGVSSIRHTEPQGKEINTVAVCGGSGSFLINKARAEGADIFISADFKYHQFFEAENGLMIADIGHYESEQFTKDIFYDLLMKNFTTFAIHLTEINTNPINYL